MNEPICVVDGVCRGDGKMYHRLKVDVSRVDGGSLRAEAVSSQGVKMPCAVYPVGFAVDAAVADAADPHYVIASPLLDGAGLTISVWESRGGQAVPLISFPAEPPKPTFLSRLKGAKPLEEVPQIRDIDQRRLSGMPFVYVQGVFPAGNGEVVCRFHATFPYRDASEYRVQVVDGDGRAIDVPVLKLEEDVSHSPNDEAMRLRELSYSFRVPESKKVLCISVVDAGEPDSANFTCLSAGMFEGFLNGAIGLLQNASQDPAYPQWFEKHRATDGDLRRQRDAVGAWERRPQLSLVCPVFGADAGTVRPLLRSLTMQSYGAYELVLVASAADCDWLDALLAEVFGPDDERVRVLRVENGDTSDARNAGVCASGGDYIGFLEPDAILEPDALYRYAAVIRQDEVADLLYCDEDMLNDGRYERPVFKPGFNPDLLYSYDYIGHMLMVSRAVLGKVGLPENDVAEAYAYDLTLKCAEQARTIRNISHVLYHSRRHGAESGEAGRLAVQRHWDRADVSAVVSLDAEAGVYRTAYDVDDAGTKPKVSIVIPSKDHTDLLGTCLDSVFEKTGYADFDVTVVENNSTDPDTFRFYDQLESNNDRVRVVRWDGRGFNYSAICNYGAAQCDGDLLLFLNNDTEVISRDWLDSMVGFFVRPEVGVVGAKLLYRDGLVQHGGVWVSDGRCEYLNQSFARDESGYMRTLRYPNDCAAVTGACQMIRRSVFETIGGFDEELAVAFNDVDLCLRAGEAGKLTVFDPDALLFHNEYGSRGRDGMSPEGRARVALEVMRFGQRWAGLPEGRYISGSLIQTDGHYKLRW